MLYQGIIQQHLIKKKKKKKNLNKNFKNFFKFFILNNRVFFNYHF